MPSPLVSIITPSFNQGVFLPDAIESVVRQDYGPIEHLVYDGGSTDGSAAILERYGDRVTAVISPDSGQAAAINRGFRDANGEIIGWLNSDDFYYPTAVRSVVEYLQANPDCAVVYGNAQYVNSNGKPIEPYPTGDPGDLRYGCFICQPAVFIRRHVVEAVGGLDEHLRYCMDYEWWLRISTRFSLHRISTEIAAYRLHSGSKSVSEQLDSRREVARMTRRRLGATPLTCLYGYASLLMRKRLGMPPDDRAPPGAHERIATAVVAALLAIRYHPRLTADDLRLLLARAGRGRALAPGDFSPGPSV